MTDQQLKEGKEIKQVIQNLSDELEKFGNASPDGFNVFLHNVGTLIPDVKQVFLKHLNEYNKKFKEL